MGIDPAHIINHDLYFKHTDELIKNISQRTNLPVFTEMWYFKSGTPEVEAPDDFKGWTIHSEEGQSLQQHFEEGNMLEFILKGLTMEDFHLYINPLAAEIRFEDFYMGRWFEVKYLADWIKDNGIPSLQDYAQTNSELPYMLQNRKRLYEYAKNLGTTKMITFCSDKHQEWLDYFFKNKWGIEDFINWGKEKFIYVEFKDLPYFSFPESLENYYNVFIEDDFEDLRLP